MLRVGLTGGIGSGKSTISRLFRVLGVPVFEADVEAKALMQADSDLRRAITSRFGADVYDQGRLHRSRLAQQVFTDPAELEALNALVHPAVRKAFAEWSAQQVAPYVIMEAAVMAENGGYRSFDRVITVECPEEIRIQRAMERDGAARAAVIARVQAQATEEQRRQVATHTITNNGTQLVIPQVLVIHQELHTAASR